MIHLTGVYCSDHASRPPTPTPGPASVLYVRQDGDPPGEHSLMEGNLTWDEEEQAWTGTVSGKWSGYPETFYDAAVYYDEAEEKWMLRIWDTFWWPGELPYPVDSDLPRIYDSKVFHVEVSVVE